jgi:PAS domain S-box-containing protein
LEIGFISSKLKIQCCGLFSLVFILFGGYVTARIRQKQSNAEIDLRKSENICKKLSESTQSILWEYNIVNDTWDYVAPQVKEVMGYRPDEFINHQFWIERLHPNDKEFALTQYNSFTQLGEKYTLEYLFRKKDNSYIWLRDEVNVEMDNGKPIKLNGIFSDITESKLAENTIKESEEKFRLTFMTSPDSISISRLSDGLFLEVNAGFTEITGYTIEDVIGKTFEEINIWVNQNDRKQLAIGLEKFGRVSNLETKFKKKDGTVIHVLMSAGIIDIDGVPHIISITRDFEEIYKAQIEIQKLSQAVDQNPISVVITNLDGNIEYINPYFSVVTGYEFEDAIGQNPRFLNSGKQPPKFYKEMWNTISNGNTWKGEFHNKKKNGELYWEEAIITPIKYEKGNTINYCALKTDVTEKKKIAEELSSYKVHLESLVEERTKELSKSEETFRALSENSNDIIARFDKSFRYLYVSPSIEKNTRIQPNKFIGKTDRELGFQNKKR